MEAATTATEIRLDRAERILHVTFDDASTASLAAEYLRVESPSAEVQGHGKSQKITLGGKSGVGITAIEPVGNYAVRLTFDDGHDTGIYTWAYLAELGREHRMRWPAYLAALSAKRLSR
jgi:DUF971 family protein